MNSHSLRFSISISRAALAAVLAVGLSGITQVARAEDPEVNRLMAFAKAKEEQAARAKADAATKMQEATDDEVNAREAEREAQVAMARAMARMHGDANRMKAFQLRGEARKLWAEARRKWIEARNNEALVAHYKHETAELQKAAAEVKDQPDVANGLLADSRKEAANAETLEPRVMTERRAAEDMDRRAGAAWAEAERLDPEMHKQVAPMPVRPVIRPMATR